MEEAINNFEKKHEKGISALKAYTEVITYCWVISFECSAIWLLEHFQRYFSPFWDLPLRSFLWQALMTMLRVSHYRPLQTRITMTRSSWLSETMHAGTMLSLSVREVLCPINMFSVLHDSLQTIQDSLQVEWSFYDAADFGRLWNLHFGHHFYRQI